MPIERIEYYFIDCDECDAVYQDVDGYTKTEDLRQAHKDGWTVHWLGAGNTFALCPECVKRQDADTKSKKDTPQ